MSLFHRVSRALAIAAYTRGRFFLLRHVVPPLPLRDGGISVDLQGPATEGTRNSYSEVMIEDAYELASLTTADIKVVVDIGANIGLFSCRAAAIFPQAKIFAYEPNPHAYEFLRANAKCFGGIVPICAAVSNVLKEGFVSAGADTVTTVVHAQASEGSSVPVVCCASEEVAAGREIDLLKMDCEGGEFDILQDRRFLSRVRRARIEFHTTQQHPINLLLALIKEGGHQVVHMNPSHPPAEGVGYIFTERA